MNKYKYWAHRLYPKMPFDEVIERVEKIGQKREVKVCVYFCPNLLDLSCFELSSVKSLWPTAFVITKTQTSYMTS
jgi:hypothetical protein